MLHVLDFIHLTLGYLWLMPLGINYNSLSNLHDIQSVHLMGFMLVLNIHINYKLHMIIATRIFKPSETKSTDPNPDTNLKTVQKTGAIPNFVFNSLF